MRAVKCGVFQLLTAVNELMSFKRQHDNDCGFQSTFFFSDYKNMAQWTQMKNVNVPSYDYVQITKATALFVTGYECFSPCPDMYILRPVACHVLVSLQRQRHGFAICYKRDKLNLAYFCNMWLVSMSTFFVCGGLVCNHIKPTLGFIAAFNTLLVNWWIDLRPHSKSISSKYGLHV